VHGTTGEDPTEPWRSSPFPHPAMPHEPYIADLAQRLHAVGVHPASNAMGLDFGPGGACIRCATCDGFPCQVGAKSDAENCALDPAIATGNVQLLEEALVRQIVVINGMVDHLVVDTPTGSIEIHARSFVLSAGAVNSAALLLRSDIANSSGMVGRNFMMHNNAHIAAVDLRQRNDVTFQKTLSVNDWYLDGGDGYPLGTMQLIGKVQGLMMKSWATKVPLIALNSVARRSVEWLVMAEDLPDPNNRVLVGADGQITTSRTARGMSTHRLLLKRAKRLLRSVGYDAVFTQNFDISMNSHQCGTVLAGTNPSTSVVDPWCRSHDLANLWVIDGGFFPSSAAMNPALTIAAQALRCVAESNLGR
jgi:choline dehydrogenase-like flavoprotein